MGGNFCLSGLIAGILLGILLRRGFFCFYNGMANMVITKDYRIIRATIWAFLLTMISFHTLASLGIIVLNPKPFFWVASVVGAVIFGIGMTLSGSCIVGTPLRAASGLMGYWITLLGMGSGGWLVIWGPLASFRKNTLQEATKIMLKGKNPTLDAIFGANHWVIVVILTVICGWLLFILRSKTPGAYKEKSSLSKKIFKGLWSPLAIGISFAVVETIAFLGGKSPAGLGGFIKGYATFFRATFADKFSWGWPTTEVTGILIGVFIAAVIAGEFKIIWPRMRQIPRLFFGGFLMGIGAVIAAGGCNVAHIISHMPQLSIGSFISGITIVITVWIIVYYTFVGKKS